MKRLSILGSLFFYAQDFVTRTAVVRVAEGNKNGTCSAIAKVVIEVGMAMDNR